MSVRWPPSSGRSRCAGWPTGRPGRPTCTPPTNLPAEKHSHGLRRLAAAEAARGSSPTGGAETLLVLQVDGKGIVMRPEALRPGTAKAAGQATHKLSGRLSKGEKRYRKRIAEVGAVADVTPVVRTVADILPATNPNGSMPRPGPPPPANG